jgi:AcrR family transcriptional regulator
MPRAREAGAAAGQDRPGAIVRVAYRRLAERGFEGLRVRDVAAEAGINHATLLYYFPSKAALIHGVVDHLLQEFRTSRIPRSAAGRDAFAPREELRQEFEDLACRFRETPELFVVLAELHGRARRDRAVARALAEMDRLWHSHLLGILRRGVRAGVFRRGLDCPATATAIMVQLKGVGQHLAGKPDAGDAGPLLSLLAAQIERWVTG